MQDAKRCISSSGSIIERAPLQTYAALLFFSPATSQVRQRFWDQRLPTLGRVQGIKSDWEARLQTLEGHREHVIAVTFSPVGQFLASASEDHTVRLWNPNTGTKLQTLVGHSDSVFKVEFSSNSRLVASASADKTIKIWITESGSHKHTLQGHFRQVMAMVFSPDSNSMLSVAADYETKLWDIETGICQRTVHVFPDLTPGSSLCDYDDDDDDEEDPNALYSTDPSEEEEEDDDDKEEDKEKEGLCGDGRHSR